MKSDCNIIVDLSNIVWTSYYGDFHPKTHEDEQYLEPLLIQETIKRILGYYRKFHATGVLVACDSAPSWRKSIYPDYKANRKKELILYYDRVVKTINDFAVFFNENTSIQAIKVENAEADDVIYGACHASKVPCVIISSDKDFIQLLSLDNVRLYAPVIMKERESSNPKLDLFVKCMRGDSTDNVDSAYPRVREKMLEAAFEDPTKMVNLMESYNKSGVKVKDLYERNKNLIDLSAVPKYLYKDIQTAIRTQQTRGYDYVRILKVLKSYQLVELIDEVDSISAMLRSRFVL